MVALIVVVLLVTLKNGNPEIIRVKFEDLISNIEIQIWNRLSFGWVKGFETLKKYVEQNHNALVPLRYINDDGFALGGWLGTRRQEYKNEKLQPDRIRQLESIEGWVWGRNGDDGRRSVSG